MQEALEALIQSGRPLLARVAEARELEREAHEAYLEAVRVRGELEERLERERQERQRRVKGPRVHARDEFFTERLEGADVRDAILRFKGGFTISELAAELDSDAKEIRKFLKPMLLSGVVKDTGEKLSGRAIYEYCEPVGLPSTPPPKRAPVELTVEGAGSERRATGEPVRVSSMSRLTRQQRSGSANVHFHRMRDRRYEQMMEAREKSAEAAREKAERDMEKLKNMRKKK